MEVPLALLADSANISREGKLNVLGVFDNIAATSFPTTHAAMVLVIGISASPAEYGLTRKCRIRLLDADAEQLLAIEGDLEVNQPSDLAGAPSVYFPLPLPAITFQHAGDYAFHILIGDDEKATIPFRLTDASGDRSEEV